MTSCWSPRRERARPVRAYRRGRTARAARGRGAHHRHADRAPQAPVGAGGAAGSASRSTRPTGTPRAGPAPTSPGSPSPTPRSPRTRRCTGSARRTGARWSSSTRSTTPATRCPGGRGHRGVRPGPAQARADRHAVPQRREPDPVRHLHERTGRRQAQRLGLRLRLRSRAGGRRGPAGDLPGLLRRDALADPGRGRDHGHPGHADDQGPDRAGLADGAGSGGGVGQSGARGRRQAADRGAPRHARRGRPGHRGRPRGRPGLRRAAARADRQASRRRVVRRQGREQEDLLVRGIGRALDGRGADGVRGRRHPPAGRRRVRDQRVHRPVLRPGGRPVRPRPAARGRPRRCSFPPCPCCCPTPPNSRPNGTTCYGPRSPRRPRTSSPRPSGSAIPRTRSASRPSSALNASAHFDRVLYDGGEFGTATAAGSPEEEDFLGLPGLLDPDQVRALLRQRQDAQRQPPAPPTPAARPLSRPVPDPPPARPHRTPSTAAPGRAR